MALESHRFDVAACIARVRLEVPRQKGIHDATGQELPGQSCDQEPSLTLRPRPSLTLTLKYRAKAKAKAETKPNLHNKGLEGGNIWWARMQRV